ncbi:MAG: SGNH/GDSL hydrolase family protein, partial [Candidatus Promineifilaceae bacterium]
MKESRIDWIVWWTQVHLSSGYKLLLSAALFLLLAACDSADHPAAGQLETGGTDGLRTAEPRSATSSHTTEPLPTPLSTPSRTADSPVMTDTIRYPADDARIRYTGRFDFHDPKRPVFDWPGVAIEFAFEGTGLAIFLEDDSNFYNVTVDSRSQVLDTESGRERYVVAEGLEPGEHYFRMVKRTEAIIGSAVFGGVEIARGELLEPPPGKGRRIEFIGDSITAGFGNEGDSPECLFSAATQNAEKAYAALVAAELDADYSLIAVSGLGVYYPLQMAGVSTPETAIDFIDRVLAFDHSITWPPERQTPDAVVISLGTNDYSSDPVPEDDAFIEAYLELLDGVRGRYPEAYIFAVAGPLVFQQGPQMIETVVERFQSAGDKRVTYVFIE